MRKVKFMIYLGFDREKRKINLNLLHFLTPGKIFKLFLKR